jgi:hypothetical protein
MFLDQKLSRIQADKARLAICCDLRRHLVHIEFRAMVTGAFRTVSNIALGFAVVEQIIRLLRDRTSRRSNE